jgi:transcriptional regulator with XRE-family HTH domain
MGTQPRIADRLRELRGAAGFTQVDLAAKANVSLATIVEIETGKRRRPHIRTMWRLAEALGVELDDLLEEAS